MTKNCWFSRRLSIEWRSSLRARKNDVRSCCRKYRRRTPPCRPTLRDRRTSGPPAPAAAGSAGSAGHPAAPRARPSLLARSVRFAGASCMRSSELGSAGKSPAGSTATCAARTETWQSAKCGPRRCGSVRPADAARPPCCGSGGSRPAIHRCRPRPVHRRRRKGHAGLSGSGGSAAWCALTTTTARVASSSACTPDEAASEAIVRRMCVAGGRSCGKGNISKSVSRQKASRRRAAFWPVWAIAGVRRSTGRAHGRSALAVGERKCRAAGTRSTATYHPLRA